MKKRILVMTLVAALLAGCGTKEAASAGKTSDRDTAVQTARETDPASTPQAGEVVNCTRRRERNCTISPTMIQTGYST